MLTPQPSPPGGPLPRTQVEPREISKIKKNPLRKICSNLSAGLGGKEEKATNGVEGRGRREHELVYTRRRNKCGEKRITLLVVLGFMFND